MFMRGKSQGQAEPAGRRGTGIPRTGRKPTVAAALMDRPRLRASCLHQGGPVSNPLICKACHVEGQSRVTRRATRGSGTRSHSHTQGHGWASRRTPRVGLGFHGSRPRTLHLKNRLSTVSGYFCANEFSPGAMSPRGQYKMERLFSAVLCFSHTNK